MPRKSRISQTPADTTRPCHRGTLIVQGLPSDTKAAFKSACARREKTMRDVIIELMREYVARV